MDVVKRRLIKPTRIMDDITSVPCRQLLNLKFTNFLKHDKKAQATHLLTGSR